MAKPATGRKPGRHGKGRTAEIIAFPRGGDLPANDNGPVAAAVFRQSRSPASPDSILVGLLWAPLLWPSAMMLGAWTSWCGAAIRVER